MSRDQAQRKSWTVLAAVILLGVPVVYFGERGLLWISGGRVEAAGGEELTAMDVDFLHDLGVVAEDEQVRWIVSHGWPNIRERAELVVTDRRVVRYWPESVEDRAPGPDETLLRREERTYGMLEVGLTSVVDVDSETRSSASGNSLTLHLDDGSTVFFCVYDTGRDDIARIRADILRR